MYSFYNILDFTTTRLISDELNNWCKHLNFMIFSLVSNRFSSWESRDLKSVLWPFRVEFWKLDWLEVQNFCWTIKKVFDNHQKSILKVYRTFVVRFSILIRFKGTYLNWNENKNCFKYFWMVPFSINISIFYHLYCLFEFEHKPTLIIIITLDHE